MVKGIRARCADRFAALSRRARLLVRIAVALLVLLGVGKLLGISSHVPHQSGLFAAYGVRFAFAVALTALAIAIAVFARRRSQA
jgi:hypothetical protein